MNKTQETDLVAQILKGDLDSYRYFIDRYHRGLILHLNNILSDEALADDVAQEAFINAFKNLAKYDTNYAFSTWLYKIADNLAFRQLKKNARFILLEDNSLVSSDEDVSPSEYAEQQLTKEMVISAIDKLPTNYKQVISLYYWDNFDYKAIAEIVGCPEGTIKTWLYRAKAILRKELYGQVR